MTTDVALNPAEEASREALDKIRFCIDQKKHFLLEAGAGAGKTYSLIETLKYLIASKGKELIKSNQKIACITYTNVAADEINSRTDSHPAIHSSTIHAFCWSLIKRFQPFLRSHLPSISSWQEKINESEGINNQVVSYELGFRKISDDEITLHHDDILTLMVALLEQPKFRTLFAKKYPIVFIDEYQDTNKEFVESLKTAFLDNNETLLLGFFGDHWQKIYGAGCGKIEHPNLVPIGKQANFRSVPVIVSSLNRMRPALTQQVKDTEATGSVKIYHTNDWSGVRREGNHWQDDLPANIAHEYLQKIKSHLFTEGWDLAPNKTKILMLTHNVLASEQGYSNLASNFRYNDAFLKKEDPHIAFFMDILEPVCLAYKAKHFGKMFSYLGGRTPKINSLRDKQAWAQDMNLLMRIRDNQTVGEVIDHLIQTKRPRLSEAVEKKERKLIEWLSSEADEENSSLEELKNFKEVSYKEVIALYDFLNGHTLFNTKHGVKGAEFENVLVVFGRGWNQYNFNQFLEWESQGIPTGKQDNYERNKNLFYVACSRSKKRLCLMFTQKLSDPAIQTLNNWFGSDVVMAAPSIASA